MITLIVIIILYLKAIVYQYQANLSSLIINFFINIILHSHFLTKFDLMKFLTLLIRAVFIGQLIQLLQPIILFGNFLFIIVEHYYQTQVLNLVFQPLLLSSRKFHFSLSIIDFMIITPYFQFLIVATIYQILSNFCFIFQEDFLVIKSPNSFHLIIQSNLRYDSSVL